MKDRAHSEHSQTLQQANKHAADLYWLAFLLTGNREVSVDVAVEALDSQDGASFFSIWMLAWSRKIVIAKALAAVREELACSARRTELKHRGRYAPAQPNWVLGQDATKLQLERALLAIDVFPRCALVLSIFEGLSPDDLTILLSSGRELIRKAQMIGLQELTSNLASMDGRTSIPNNSALTEEVQHA